MIDLFGGKFTLKIHETAREYFFLAAVSFLFYSGLYDYAGYYNNTRYEIGKKKSAWGALNRDCLSLDGQDNPILANCYTLRNS